VDVVFERLFEHEGEVARFGAVAVVVSALVVDLRHGHVEHALSTCDLRGDLRQVGDLQRRTVLLDDLHERNVVQIQLVVLDRKFVLREIERLFDQVFVLVFHALSGSFSGIRPSYIGRNPAK
jgi:hypothetical protein